MRRPEAARRIGGFRTRATHGRQPTSAASRDPAGHRCHSHGLRGPGGGRIGGHAGSATRSMTPAACERAPAPTAARCRTAESARLSGRAASAGCATARYRVNGSFQPLQANSEPEPAEHHRAPSRDSCAPPSHGSPGGGGSHERPEPEDAGQQMPSEVPLAAVGDTCGAAHRPVQPDETDCGADSGHPWRHPTRALSTVPEPTRERVRPAPPQVRGQRDGQAQPHADKPDLNQRGLPDRLRRAGVTPALRIAIRRAQQRTENGVRQHRDEEPRPDPGAESQRCSRYAHPPRPHQRERHCDPDPCHTDRCAVEHHPLHLAEPGPDRQQPQERTDHPRHLDQQVRRQRQRCPIRRDPPDPIPPIHLNSQFKQRSSILIHHCPHGR
ncbi:hypothetical protein Save01_03369 [Streptomyces avermitilis]